jgi:hypothetical protein
MTCPEGSAATTRLANRPEDIWPRGASDASWRGADGSNASAVTIAGSRSRFCCRKRRAPHSNEGMS